tara:strand:- start:738 stop:1229 length:492 start_codon:yes stop_codon:yes gene_type:complete
MSLLFLDQQPVIEKIDCLSVDIGREQLLVPMPAVAEIILNQRIEKSDRLPVWVRGWIVWRYLSIPLIDFRALQDGLNASDFGSRTRVLVMKSFAEGHSHNNYAIMTRGFPYTLSVEADCEMTTQALNDNGKCIKIDLHLQGKKFLLPNFTEIETYLKQIPRYY